MKTSVSIRFLKRSYLAILPIAFLLLNFVAPDNFQQVQSAECADNFDPIDKVEVEKALSPFLERLAKDRDDEQALALCQRTIVFLSSKYPEQKEELAKIIDNISRKYGAPIYTSYDSDTKALNAVLQQEGIDPFIFRNPDQRPELPGCQELEGKEREDCATMKLLSQVYHNIKYPAEAREKSIEGVVVSRFVVGKDGRVRDAEIVRSLGGGCEEAVLEVVQNLPVFIPAKHEGENVAVYFTLPVKFKLESGKKKDEPEKE